MQFFFFFPLNLSSDEMNILKLESGSETPKSNLVGYQLIVGKQRKMFSLGLTAQNKCRGKLFFFFLLWMISQ